jgi:undecaprenyl diphosphate synthase
VRTYPRALVQPGPDFMGAKRQLLDEYGVRLNILGKTELLPPTVQAAVKKAEDMTRNNERFVYISLSALVPGSDR